MGTSPTQSLTGIDPKVPGLQPLYETCGDNLVRQATRDQCRQEVRIMRMQEQAARASPRPTPTVGQMAQYRLTEREQGNYQHHSGNQWKPKYSFPMRIREIKGQQALLDCSAFQGKPRWRPCSQLIVFDPDLPPLLTEVAQKIYDARQTVGRKRRRPEDVQESGGP